MLDKNSVSENVCERWTAKLRPTLKTIQEGLRVLNLTVCSLCIMYISDAIPSEIRQPRTDQFNWFEKQCKLLYCSLNCSRSFHPWHVWHYFQISHSLAHTLSDKFQFIKVLLWEDIFEYNETLNNVFMNFVVEKSQWISKIENIRHYEINSTHLSLYDYPVKQNQITHCCKFWDETYKLTFERSLKISHGFKNRISHSWENLF